MKLSKKSLEIIRSLFSEESNLNLPVAIAKEVVEIRAWAENELKDEKKTDNQLLK